MKELLSAKKTLGQLIKQMKQSNPPDLEAARQLTILREGVIEDLTDYQWTDLREIAPTPGRRGFDIGGESEDTTLNLLPEKLNADVRARNAAATLAEDQRIERLIAEQGEENLSFNELRRRDNTPESERVLDALESGAPINTPGTPGQRRPIISEDTTEGLFDERSREIADGLMKDANASYRTMAEEFFEPPVTGDLIKAYRRANPVPFSEVFGRYLDPHADGYEENVQDLLQRARKSPETLRSAENYLIADAYIAATREVDRVDGPITILDRKRLVAWMDTNGAALDGFPRVKQQLTEGREWIEQAERLGARPGADNIHETIEAAKRFIKDPEAYWNGYKAKGTLRAEKELSVLIRTMKKSGDPLALEGLKESFWHHRIVRSIGESAGAEVGSPVLTMKTVRDVLGNPQQRKALEALYGPEHAVLLEKAAKLQKALNTQSRLPGISPDALPTIGEQIEAFATKASAFSVILGPIRRTAKMGKALADFQRNLDERRISAVIQQSIKDPGLLRDLLKLNPDEAIIRRIRARLAGSFPTLFPRVSKAVEKRERDQLTAQEEQDRIAREREQIPNRGMLATPNSSQGALGRFNY